MYEITERLTHSELIKGLMVLKEEMADKFYEHKNGDIYYAKNSTIINGRGGAMWGLIYCPVNSAGVPIEEIQYTRGLEEFTDGRFTAIS